MVFDTEMVLPELTWTETGLLDEPEQESLARLASLVARLFRVPVAYVALLGPDAEVSTRVGTGSEWWDRLATFPVARLLAAPVLWPDPSGAAVPGFVPGEIRFAAGAPLRSGGSLELGVLVIADIMPHAEFTSEDLRAMADLAGVLTGNIELRMLVSQVWETQQLAAEANGKRFRSIADYAPVMMICSGVDGDAWFVNKAWLEFTGRSLEEELGPGYADTFHPDYRDRIVETYWDAFQIRKPRTIRFPMLRHDGKYRLIEARGAPRFFKDGTFGGFVGCFIDLGDWEEQ